MSLIQTLSLWKTVTDSVSQTMRSSLWDIVIDSFSQTMRQNPWDNVTDSDSQVPVVQVLAHVVRTGSVHVNDAL